MSELLKRLFQICLLSRGPQDIPYSPLLLRLAVIAYFLSGLLGVMTQTSLMESVAMMALDLLVLLLFSWVCLQAFKLRQRFVQTVTALCATGTLFQLLFLPVLMQLPTSADDVTPAASLSLLLYILISWNLAVVAHVFRESFSVRLPAAFVLTLAYIIIEMSTSQFLFSGSGA